MPLWDRSTPQCGQGRRLVEVFRNLAADHRLLNAVHDLLGFGQVHPKFFGRQRAASQTGHLLYILHVAVIALDTTWIFTFMAAPPAAEGADSPRVV